MDKTLDALVLDALMGGAYALDAVLVQWRRGVPLTEADAARLKDARRQVAETASAFHAWWQAHSTETGGTLCPR